VKNKFLSFLLLLLIFLIFRQSFSQTISGFVKDESNGETMIGANVYLKGTYTGASTNKNGYYVITNVSAGRHTVVFSYIGYEQKEVTVKVSKDGPVVLNVSLKPKDFESQEIVITAEKETREFEVKTSSIEMNSRVLQAAPQMAEADLMRTLQLLPGILTLTEFSSGLYVRGGTPDQNLILLDGSEVYNVSHLFGIFSTFDIDAVKNVEVLKGGFPAEYGGRLSSVIDITNMDGNQKQFEGKSSIGLVSAKTTLQGPLCKGSWFFSGRRTYIDYAINAAEKASSGSVRETLEDIPDYYFYDAHFKIYQDFSHRDKLALTFYKGKDVLNVADETFSFDFRWGNDIITAKWTHIFSEKLFGTVDASVSDYAVFSGSDEEFMPFRVDNSVNDVKAKVTMEYFPTNRHIVKTGMVFKNMDSRYLEAFNEQEFSITSGGSLYNFYIQDNWEVVPRLRLHYGLRFNLYRPAYFKNHYNDAKFRGENRFHWEPRISFKYRVSPYATFKGSWGRYYQYINIVPFGSPEFSFLDIWFPNDNSFDTGKAHHYILGMLTELPFQMSLDSEIYYKEMYNLFEFNPTMDVMDAGKGMNMFLKGRGYAYGADFHLEKNFGRLSGWLSYFWSWTQREFPGINDGKAYFPKYDRRNNFNVVTTFRINSRWSVNMAWVYGTGQGYTRPVGQYKLDWLDRELSLIQGSERNAFRLPPYHRMDFGFKYNKKSTGLIKEWTFYSQIFNLYNHRNVWFRSVRLKKDLKPEVSDVRMLPVIPTFGFEVYF